MLAEREGCGIDCSAPNRDLSTRLGQLVPQVQSVVPGLFLEPSPDRLGYVERAIGAKMAR